MLPHFSQSDAQNSDMNSTSAAQAHDKTDTSKITTNNVTKQSSTANVIANNGQAAFK